MRPLEYQRIQVLFGTGNVLDRATLEKLAVRGYQYIVILSPADVPDIQIADASTMVALLQLRDIARQAGRTFSIVSEILDVRNRDLAEVTSADDVIISERLVALALAQIAENKAAVSVFVEFLNPGGVEIYLKPVQDYVVCGKPVKFLYCGRGGTAQGPDRDRIPAARRSKCAGPGVRGASESGQVSAGYLCRGVIVSSC